MWSYGAEKGNIGRRLARGPEKHGICWTGWVKHRNSLGLPPSVGHALSIPYCLQGTLLHSPKSFRVRKIVSPSNKVVVAPNKLHGRRALQALEAREDVDSKRL